MRDDYGYDDESLLARVLYTLACCVLFGLCAGFVFLLVYTLMYPWILVS